jgi:hypothetical protein
LYSIFQTDKHAIESAIFVTNHVPSIWKTYFSTYRNTDQYAIESALWKPDFSTILQTYQCAIGSAV